MEEQRYDYDGQLYPRSSFLEEYGDQGAALWDQAKRAEPPAAAKPPAAAAAARDEGGGHAARPRHMQPLHVERGASTGATPMGATPQRPRVNIVWHKCTDLRLHDHEPLSLAHAVRSMSSESSSTYSVVRSVVSSTTLQHCQSSNLSHSRTRCCPYLVGACRDRSCCAATLP